MIEVVCNDRLGKKVRVKCNSDDTIGDLKKLIAAQTGTPHRTASTPKRPACRKECCRARSAKRVPSYPCSMQGSQNPTRGAVPSRAPSTSPCIPPLPSRTLCQCGAGCTVASNRLGSDCEKAGLSFSFPGTRAEKIRLQKWYNIYKDHITLEDYEIKDGMGLELYYN